MNRTVKKAIAVTRNKMGRFDCDSERHFFRLMGEEESYSDRTPESQLPCAFVEALHLVRKLLARRGKKRKRHVIQPRYIAQRPDRSHSWLVTLHPTKGWRREHITLRDAMRMNLHEGILVRIVEGPMK